MVRHIWSQQGWVIAWHAQKWQLLNFSMRKKSYVSIWIFLRTIFWSNGLCYTSILEMSGICMYKFVQKKKKKKRENIWMLEIYLFECEAGCVSNIAAFSFIQWMRFVTNGEYNISRYFAMCLIALLLERDSGARFPARFNRYVHQFIFFLRCSIRLQDSSWDFHLLNTAFVDFFKCHVQIVFDWRILCLCLFFRCVYVEWMWSEKAKRKFVSQLAMRMDVHVMSLRVFDTLPKCTAKSMPWS